MPKPTVNLRDTVLKALEASKKVVVAGLRERMGPPPASVVSRAQKDDPYRLFWRLAPGWEDPVQAQAKAQALYTAGAKQADVAHVQFPDRMAIISAGDRHDDLTAQVKFCDEMLQRHFEVLAGTLREQQAVIEKGAPGGPG